MFGTGRERMMSDRRSIGAAGDHGGVLSAPAWTRHPNIAPQPAMSGMDGMDDMPGMHMEVAAPAPTPEVLAKQLADKRESEFNHHLAGLLRSWQLCFFLAQDKLASRWPGGSLCMGGVLVACWGISAGFQRHGNLARLDTRVFITR